MAAPRLTEEQRNALIEWLAAEYTEPAIRRFLADRNWPVIAGSSLQHYRNRYRSLIEEARQVRRNSALNTGLAVLEERVERLKDHADHLEQIKWLPDKNGRLWNERAWRQTLDDIAKELGQRRGDGIPDEPDEAILRSLYAAFSQRAAAGDGVVEASPGHSGDEEE